VKNYLRVAFFVIAAAVAVEQQSAQAPQSVDANSRSPALQRISPCESTAKDGSPIGHAVVLKITLLSSGKVGPVILLKKKDWRCTWMAEKAIEAAKNIKFEPKLVDGKPVTAVVKREYTFTKLEDAAQK
jgi:hypothetical protein